MRPARVLLLLGSNKTSKSENHHNAHEQLNGHVIMLLHLVLEDRRVDQSTGKQVSKTFRRYTDCTSTSHFYLAQLYISSSQQKMLEIAVQARKRKDSQVSASAVHL